MTPTPASFFGAALAYAIQQLGGMLNEVDSNPTCQLTATKLLNGNGDRVGLIIVNAGANPVWLSFTADVSTTNGIQLAPSGGNISMNVRDDFTLPTRDWWGIATGGTSQIFIIELVRIDQSGLKVQP